MSDLVTRPFRGYQKFDLVTLTLVLTYLIKTLTLAISFEMYGKDFDISNKCFL
jgi:hypothetical protein